MNQTEEIPAQIGRYKIIAELGRGGMAVVYLAEDPFIERQVAVKLLPRQFTFDPQFRSRFQREAKVIAALEHSAIVPIYDYGEHDEQPYLVMRYMTGGDLSSRLGRPLPLPEIARILNRLAPGLDKAHQQGVIHRDLKPANILFDEDDQPYLADFGIARLAEATQTMTIAGTPAYMSPEQVQGDQALDGRSDVYALGVVLFEMLTGEPPYQADTPTKLMMKHVLEPVPDILAIKADLPPTSRALITTTMAKDRRERYPTAMALASAAASLAGAGRSLEPTFIEEPAPPPVEMPSPPTTRRPEERPDSRSTSRLPVALLAGGGLVVVVLALLAAAFIGSRLLADQPTTAAEAPVEERTAVPTATPADSAAPTATDRPVEATAPPATRTTAPATATDPPPLATATDPPPAATATDPPPTDPPTPAPTAAPVVANRPRSQSDSLRSPSIWNLTEFRDMQSPGTERYNVSVAADDEWRWAFSWCAQEADLLPEILAPLSVDMQIDGRSLSSAEYLEYEESGSWYCHYWATLLSDWQPGATVELIISYQLTEPIFDGQGTFAAGAYRHILVVQVR